MTIQRPLVVELAVDGVIGFGESTENTFSGFSLDSTAGSIENCRQLIESNHFGNLADAKWTASVTVLSVSLLKAVQTKKERCCVPFY